MTQRLNCKCCDKAIKIKAEDQSYFDYYLKHSGWIFFKGNYFCQKCRKGETSGR